MIAQAPSLAKAVVWPWQWAGQLAFFWLLFFAFFRLWFVLWLRKEAQGELPWEAFWYALPLDFSTAGYLTLPGLALAFISGAFGRREHYYIARFFDTLYFAFLLVALVVYGANIFLYEEWYTPINSRAYAHFRIPGAMLSSMSAAFKVGALALLFILTWIWWRVFRWVVGVLPALPMRTGALRLNALFLVVSLFVVMRGGLGPLPINESSVCYSDSPYRNDVAINAGWYFVHSLIETSKAVNRYNALSPADAQREAESLLPKLTANAKPHGWLDGNLKQPPNIVLILLESMTAQVIAELGGVPDVCPNISQLIRQGILFEHCYGSGYRTDQGMVSVLAGYPALPDHSVVFIPEKAKRLPSLSQSLRQVGYTTAFVYGGELTFANMGIWLRHQQFEHIISVRDFSAEDITQLWGTDDQRLFARSAQLLRQLPQPFFATLMTLSLHAPYDVPFKSRWSGVNDREKFLNCAAFVDYALGEFIEKASQEPWFEHTLFVLVADHGHPLPGRIPMSEPRSRQVPLIFCGPAVAPSWRGKCISRVGGHHDLPATLLYELGLNYSAFRWSHDLFNTQGSAFAYYSNESGMGWITPQGTGFYDFKTRRWTPAALRSLQPEERTQALAYLQVLYDDFLGL